MGYNNWLIATLWGTLLANLALSLYFLPYLSTVLLFLSGISTCVLFIFQYNLWKTKQKGIQVKHRRLQSKAWYFESIVYNSKDIIFTTDKEHRIVLFNKEAEETFGMSPLEVLGKRVESLFKHSEDVQSILSAVEIQGYSDKVELCVQNSKNSEDIWISASAAKLYPNEEAAHNKTHQGMIGEIFTCQNITEKKLLESELKKKNQQLTQLSITDELTGLFNIRHFKSQAARYQKIHQRHEDRSLSLALIDIDKFKEYNDREGHLAGDNLLITLAKIIQQQIRQDLDASFRYGGDEFVLLFPDTTAQECALICERILESYRAENLGETSLSIGITEYQKEWGILKENTLVKKADEAMYTVKCNGGNGICIYAEPVS